MYVVREIMHCKPGKVRPLIEKMRAMGKISEKLGMPCSRLLTDITGQPYWTVISETEVANLEEYLQPDEKAWADAGADKAMAGYHDLVDHGRREIFKIESADAR